MLPMWLTSNALHNKIDGSRRAILLALEPFPRDTSRGHLLVLQCPPDVVYHEGDQGRRRSTSRPHGSRRLRMATARLEHPRHVVPLVREDFLPKPPLELHDQVVCFAVNLASVLERT